MESYGKEFETHNGDNILVGNSAAATNNHLDLLEYLKTLDLNGRKLILPLSYAGGQDYVIKVVTRYRNFFGDSVVALTDFMPYDEYKKSILSCGTAFFFMERQQAMGNISAALKYGCKVFLSERNPVFAYYKKLGIKVFSVENGDLSSDLTTHDVETNRKILTSLHNREAFLRKLDSVYAALCG